MIHHLKITKPWYADVRSGRKTFEVRKDDRSFQTGDLLRLYPYPDALGAGAVESHVYRPLTMFRTLQTLQMQPDRNDGPAPSSHDMWRLVTYVYRGPGVKQSYVVLGLEPIKPGDFLEAAQWIADRTQVGGAQ